MRGESKRLPARRERGQIGVRPGSSIQSIEPLFPAIPGFGTSRSIVRENMRPWKQGGPSAEERTLILWTKVIFRKYIERFGLLPGFAAGRNSGDCLCNYATKR